MQLPSGGPDEANCLDYIRVKKSQDDESEFRTVRLLDCDVKFVREESAGEESVIASSRPELAFMLDNDKSDESEMGTTAWYEYAASVPTYPTRTPSMRGESRIQSNSSPQLNLDELN